jgi:hypothetical protein
MSTVFKGLTDLISKIFQSIMLGVSLYSATTSDIEDVYKINKKKEEEALALAEKEEEPATRWGRFKRRTGKLFYSAIDIGTSPTMNMIIALITTVSIFFISPVAPWVAGVALALVAISITASVLYQTYKRYNLKNLQREDKVLNQIIEMEKERYQAIQKTKERIDLLENSDAKVNYLNLIKKLEETLYKTEGYSREKYKANLLKAYGKSLLTNTPVEVVWLGVSIITLNPISCFFSACSTLLTYSSTVRNANAYDKHKAKLLNHMEKAKQELGFSYAPGKGLTILHDVAHKKEAENQAIISTLARIEQSVSKKEPVNVEEQISLFVNERQKAELSLTKDEPANLSGKAQEFFKTMGKVLVYGFSKRKTQQKFTPLYKHEYPLKELKVVKENYDDFSKNQEQKLLAISETYKEKQNLNGEAKAEVKSESQKKNTLDTNWTTGFIRNAKQLSQAVKRIP